MTCATVFITPYIFKECIDKKFASVAAPHTENVITNVLLNVSAIKN